MVSINLFSLLCDGTIIVTTSSLGQPQHFGGPILYLVIQSCGLFVILSCASGSFLPRGSFIQVREPALPDNLDVEANVEHGSSDLLQVVQISKSFQSKKAVDNVSFGVSPNTIFALLGPNGAGKTTTFNMIRKTYLVSP
jgi:ATP-binding cassette, subfamily A (ABC1), member 3